MSEHTPRKPYQRLRDTNLPPAKSDRIPQLWAEHGSVQKIARELGISRNAVYRLLRKRGLVPVAEE